MKPITKVSDILGLTLTRATHNGDEVYLYLNDGNVVRMLHHQDCCESVSIEDMDGDLEDMVGGVFVQFDIATSDEPDDLMKIKRALLGKDMPDEDGDSQTWTFYRLATTKGSVVIRWFGESNGYYSEDVDVEVRDPLFARYTQWKTIS